MKIKAIASMGVNLSARSLNNGHLPTENYRLKIGDIYVVYGIKLWKGEIHYLTLNETNRDPFWNPAELFEVVDYRLPPKWYYRFNGYEEGKYFTHNEALWGYKELIFRENHYDDLIERDWIALGIFNKRREEIDQFHSQLETEQED